MATVLSTIILLFLLICCVGVVWVAGENARLRKQLHATEQKLSVTRQLLGAHLKDSEHVTDVDMEDDGTKTT